MSNVIPTDVEFQTAFSTARVSQHNLARYYLRAIEAHLRNETDMPELMPARDPKLLNLEHILPQEQADNWPHIDAETFEAYAKRIGNLTLIKSKTNVDLGNASFQDKRTEFKKSQILLTSRIYEMTNDNTKWGPKEINDRQKKIAELAIKTWPLAPKQLNTLTL